MAGGSGPGAGAVAEDCIDLVPLLDSSLPRRQRRRRLPCPPRLFVSVRSLPAIALDLYAAFLPCPGTPTRTRLATRPPPLKTTTRPRPPRRTCYTIFPSSLPAISTRRRPPTPSHRPPNALMDPIHFVPTPAAPRRRRPSTPPSLLAPDYPINPAGPASSASTDFKCHKCDKVYKGKHARSIWRRHLQDKHGIPLASQPRRTRWDNGECARVSLGARLSLGSSGCLQCQCGSGTA